MYTEDYDELSEAENKPLRQYVSSIPHSESGKLLRENDRLKKSLEKEQFFNKLLDQELKDIKATLDPNADYTVTPYNQPQGVSKGAFYTLLIITLALAGYIAYGLYNGGNKTYSGPVTRADVITDSVPNIIANAPANTNAGTAENAASGNLNNASRNVTPAVKEKAPEVLTPAERRVIQESKLPQNQVETPVKPVETVKQPANTGAGITTTNKAQGNLPATNASAGNGNLNNSNGASNNNAATTTAPTTLNPNSAGTAPVNAAPPTDNKAALNDAITQNQAAAGPDTRPVIAYYTVTSKANFYTRPDENTMRSAFIAQYNHTKVGALEENNGFIYVIYTNDLGYTIKGWLSLKDLTKAQ